MLIKPLFYFSQGAGSMLPIFWSRWTTHIWQPSSDCETNLSKPSLMISFQNDAYFYSEKAYFNCKS